MLEGPGLKGPCVGVSKKMLGRGALLLTLRYSLDLQDE